MLDPSDSSQFDVVRDWSARKHGMLRDYLSAYTTIMRTKPWCRNGYHYIDAFAGSGRPMLRDADAERYIDGSPRVALGIAHPFSTYTFIEMSGWRVEQLKRLQADFPERTIRVERGDCNRVIVEKVTPRIRRERFNRGFIFLDPFGNNLAWDTVEAIAETGALEVFLNFPTMGLNRAALHNKPDALTAEKVEQMNRVWGAEDWRGLFYGLKQDLFGEVHEVKVVPTGAERLGRLFVERRLSKVFKHVSDPIVMTNSQGAPIYCLIFAGHNSTGAEIATQIFGSHRRRKRIPQGPSPSARPATLPLLDWTG